MEISYIPIPNVSGSLFLGGWSNDNEKNLVNQLLKRNIDLVIGLGFKNHPLNNYNLDIDVITYDIRDSADRYSKEFMEVILDEVLPIIDDALTEGENVYIHCKMGISRSSSVVIAYLMEYEEMSFKGALEYVKKYRSIINPNKGFREILKKRELEYYKF